MIAAEQQLTRRLDDIIAGLGPLERRMRPLGARGPPCECDLRAVGYFELGCCHAGVMDSPATTQSEKPPILVLIVGPIAGGKSTVARALAERLRQSGEKVALVELDQIAEMALPTLPDWAIAHTIFNSVVGHWLRNPFTVVIAEGPGNESEVNAVLAQVPSAASVVTVVLTSSFELAFSRAQADPTRGISRDHQFLFNVFQSWERDMPHIAHDLLIDTGSASVDESVATIQAELHRSRQ